MDFQVQNSSFELLLCSTDLSLIQTSVQAGVDGIVVEWEAVEGDRSPSLTQEGIKTLEKIRTATNAWLICRLNPYYEKTREEVEQALTQNVDEIWLPKVQSLAEVLQVLTWVDNRVKVGIVVETLEAINLSSQLSNLPLYRVHIGLNDLAESLNKAHPFCSLIDGTVETILQNFAFPSGFGGLTLPEKGTPIPSHLLMGELLRLNCTFSLLRRSFIADIQEYPVLEAIPRIKSYLGKLSQRPLTSVEHDHQDFVRRVKTLINQ